MGTIDNIFVLHVVINHLLNENKKLYATFIDYTKAFDYVVRENMAIDSNSTVLHFDSLNKPDLSWPFGPVAVQSLTQSLSKIQWDPLFRLFACSYALCFFRNQHTYMYPKSFTIVDLVCCIKIFLQFISLLARLYENTRRAIAVTTASALASALIKMLKFLVKVFISLYLLNPWMNLVDTLPDVRY